MKDKLRILFATNFSASSKVALMTLYELRKIYQTTVIWQYVITSFWRHFFSSEIYKQEALQRLQTWQQQSVSGEAIDDELDVIIGNVADCILSLADQENVDLILLGGESAHSEDYFITGTTAESVVRNAKQLVWLCKKDTISNVICGIDGSATSAKALKEAIDICQRFYAKLNIVNVLPAAEYNPLGMEHEQIKSLDEKFKEESITKIENFLQPFDFSKIDVSFHYPWGMPSNVILHMAEDFDHDLIVIGATGESKLKQVLLGSTTEKILRHAPCSLLVVR